MFEPQIAGPNLTVCDREPITRIDRIQPFGFLLALSLDWTVVRASANLAAMIGMAPAQVMGAKVDTFLDRSALHDIRNRMLALYLTRGTERLFGITLVKDRGPFDLSVHQSGDLFVLEGEPCADHAQLDAATLVRSAMARLATRKTLQSFHADAARQIRALSGFDRVMVYRFDEHGDGEVIAEALSADMESYLGLHYPASDIPLQARELYLRNLFRIIPDVRAGSVPLAASGTQAASVDLSLAVTRAVSPVHIEYLRNMGVAASMSISIVVERRLWGLIACHHKEPRLPSFVTRTAAELLGQMYSLSLESRLREQASRQESRLAEVKKQILTSVVGDDALLTRAEWLQEVLRDVIDGQGTAVAFHGTISVAGDTPDLNVIEDIVTRLKSESPPQPFVTDHLAGFVPSAARSADRAAGLLAIPISSSPRDYILLFRREVLRDVRWAGNPQKPVHSDPAARISPRKSFAVFEERVAGRSIPFSERERDAAEAIRSALIEVVLRMSENVDDARQRAAGRQEILIAELNHRVRNILALMRGLVTQSSTDATSVEGYVAAIGGRIQSLARAHDRVTRRNWSPAPLSELLDDEIAAYVPGERHRFVIVGAPVLLMPKAFSTMALVIHELVTNSCKYGALSARGRVEIDVNLVPAVGLHLKWREREGPTVTTPARRGFGSVIIERTVPFDLQGTAAVEYPPSGFEAAFFIPQLHLAAMAAPADVRQAEAGHSLPRTAAVQRTLDGLVVLLLEDNFIVSLEADEMLRALGAASVLTASSVAAALQVVHRDQPRFAMLDINIGVETSVAVAEQLRRLAIPFIYASGYGDALPQTGAWPPAPVIAKPFDRDLLAGAAKQALEVRDGIG